MTARWFRKDQTQSQAETLFEALNEAARAPALYAAAGAPDTIEGRFEVLALHVFLAMRRLKRDAPASDRLSGALQEVFFRRLDDALREIGIGDLSIGRKIRGLAEAFYGRAIAYDKALNEGPEPVAAALARNVLESADASRARRLADYALTADRRLIAAPADKLVETIGGFGAIGAAIPGRDGDERPQEPA
jgi:cytochrome b pre-mRNA-processing protein 3